MSSVSAFPTTQLSDETLVARLYDMALSGEDGSEEFHRLDAECQRRLVSATATPEILKSIAATG
ncbi:hypothetical protein [Alkalisalibacterium limincola]|uniref:Uncharacterized protein n=1 Tax=Alkalisalibacterium limincola TaxID=2699169 RepID=A0A5C8KYM3_9GAMM|nr:hypothetical protein [Alkalisalibacterium limincola]TXK64375.1 hypothetical protein FU658_05610 [Alkalisalibacterium limincola]